MTDYWVDPPPSKSWSVTKGCHLAFTVQRQDDGGDPENFGEGQSVIAVLDIDRADPTVVQATISGSYAAIVITPEVTDQCRTGTRMRVILDDSLDTPLQTGRIERHD